MDLRGRTALVTGAARRLGRATALGLARAGADVVIHHGTSAAEARVAVREAQALGVRAWAVQADLRSESEIARLFDEACRHAGRVDVLINSASIFPASELERFTRAELAASIDVNAWAPLTLSRRFAAAGEEGAIVNFLDTRVRGYDEGHVAYHASKTLLELFTRQLALRFAPRITVNAVAPGLILPPAGEGPEHLARLARTVPLRRAGEPADVVDAVLYLVGSRYVTGQVIWVDGGRHLGEVGGG